MNPALRTATLLAALTLATGASFAQTPRPRPASPQHSAAPLFQPVPFLQQTQAAAQPAQPNVLVAAITLADVGFINGIRFANLGGRREIFIKVPQGVDLSATELVLNFDDLSAHEARRTLEVMVNERSVAAIALDGNGAGRAYTMDENAALRFT